ncbi:MAG TPA: amino acid carrier protein, partial [Longimicrobiales bacterium]|nr:amino acid carrier protein [Longimicrobiales bacterium]
VTLAQHYREVTVDLDPKRWEGSVSGGPMYYIERGLGPKFGRLAKYLAVFFASALMLTAFLTGNGVQANTVADIVQTTFGVPTWITGLVTAAIVAAVILGGIQRIGRVTGILAPLMALIYVGGALVVLLRFYDQVIPTFGLILREAFNPTAGIAGVGMGTFIATMMWGVRRGLFSNEAGQGSAPIAHAAAKTDEPVSEGVVALLEPFIDTILICSMTGLVILITGVWTERVPTRITLGGGDISYVQEGVREGALITSAPPSEIVVVSGVPQAAEGGRVLAWHEVKIEEFFIDAQMTQPFTGTIYPTRGLAEDPTGVVYSGLFGAAVESGAPLTQLAFSRGLPGNWGGIIVILSVLLFAVSTAIAWSYYGDRCAYYLFGAKAVLPYKMVFVGMHFFGAVSSLAFIWTLGDVALGAVTFPNLLALILLSGTVAALSKSYFERRPWVQNAEDHRRAVERERAERMERKEPRP